ncbi:hypothetical protein [Agrobacterium bohemicum]|uniref:hypothetical protein n=1 Tax=Agrobacterium bohemicum TaxID=2052828 RepID=UPI0014739F0E|nr:hypothetical protein [Agrobacterium bohemicum]
MNAFARVLEAVCRGTVDGVPSVGRVLLPLAVFATIDVPVSSGIDVATFACGDEATVSRRIAPAQYGCVLG